MRIREFRPDDLDQVAAVLLRIRGHCGTYPPAYVPAALEGVGEWLDRYPAQVRLVAADDDGRVFGHVQLVPADATDSDLPAHLDEHTDVPASSCVEVARLFVDPTHRGRGAGRELLRAAADIARRDGFRAALCVLVTQQEAVNLYRSEGWEELGSFIGVSGLENLVFVAPTAPGPHTTLVHSGVRPGPERAVATPISVSTTFGMDHPAEYGEFAYARSQNPTRKALEEALAAAEGARHAHAFASGLAAIDAVLRTLAPGTSVLVGNDAYGGSWRLLDKVWSAHGIGTVVADVCDVDAVDAAFEGRSDIAMVLVETPSNPRLQIADVGALADVAHRAGALLCVDNTFASPWLQQPLAMGADVVTHSATKYIGGHSDVTGGVLATNDERLAEQFAFTQRAVGAVPGPFDSFLMLRGLRTLGLRMDRHCDNAEAVAAMLVDHPDVSAVLYPGLQSHPGHDLARRQMRRYGGMVSFVVTGGEQRAKELCRATKLFTLAESLGAVESLIEHPHSMTHAANSGSDLAVDPALVRLSVGIEDIGDLLLDLRQALAATS